MSNTIIYKELLSEGRRGKRDDNRSWKSAGEKRQGFKRRDKQAMKGKNKADRNSENN